ncbi:MAG: hypothetical protein LBH49_03135 [Puniceicoccales bacterium]|jgi:hypothetical protein|nr:hypothetical protein [Puniceicoccales bacterium]
MFIDINKGKKVLMFVASGTMLIASCFGGGDEGDKSKDIKGVSIDGSMAKIELKPVKYTSLKSIQDAKYFAMALTKANENQIVIDGQSSEGKISDAVKLVLGNTIKNLWSDFSGNFDSFDASGFPKDKKPFLAAVLWVMQGILFLHSIDTSIFCLNLLHRIAESSFEKAELLLLSQCKEEKKGEPGYNFTPNEDANWNIIGEAIMMLENEKNGNSQNANGLLIVLKQNKEFSAWLGE